MNPNALDPQQLVLRGLDYVALVLALCVHEFTHAAVAKGLGDDTADAEGRLTLNPLAHVDPIGTILLPALAMFFTGSPLLGWARPVPIQPRNFRRGWYAKGQVLVAAAGPASNLLQALGWTAAYAVVTRVASPAAAQGTPIELLAHFIESSIVINLVLAAFNILPVPPLDGSHVASWSLPRRFATTYDLVATRFGFVFLIAMMLPLLGGRSILGFLLDPAYRLAGMLVREPFSGWSIPFGVGA